MQKTAFTGEVFELERQLQTSLRRIAPNPGFVDHLHTRLTRPATTQVEKRRASLAVSLFIAAAALISGALLVWFWQALRREN